MATKASLLQGPSEEISILYRSAIRLDLTLAAAWKNLFVQELNRDEVPALYAELRDALLHWNHLNPGYLKHIRPVLYRPGKASSDRRNHHHLHP